MTKIFHTFPACRRLCGRPVTSTLGTHPRKPVATLYCEPLLTAAGTHAAKDVR